MTGREPGTPQRPDGFGEAESAQDRRMLRERIARTRAEVGDTVQALAERSDVKGQAKGRATDVAGRAKERITDGSAAVRQKGEEIKERFSERAGPRGEQLRQAVGQAQDAARRAAERARGNRKQIAYALGALFATSWLMRLRRRRRMRRSGED